MDLMPQWVFQAFSVAVFIGGLFWFGAFVVRLPSIWVNGYGARLVRPATQAQKEAYPYRINLATFYAWIAKSRLRAAIFSMFMLWTAVRMWQDTSLFPFLSVGRP
jgi:hypothetical protein